MTQEELVNKLSHKNINPTANRILVLKTLMEKDCPMSLADLENELLTMDKSSIFRVLQLFAQKDMVDTFEDGRGVHIYEICSAEGRCDGQDAHLHFYCEKCHKSFCFKDVQVKDINIPQDFKINSISFVIGGICPNCSKRK